MTGVAAHLDDLRIAVGETEALATVTAESFDRQPAAMSSRSTRGPGSKRWSCEPPAPFARLRRTAMGLAWRWQPTVAQFT
jgi:hypothetical protein